jgi:hypothetical protein
MKKALWKDLFRNPLGTSWLSPHLGGDRNRSSGGRALAPSFGALTLET